MTLETVDKIVTHRQLVGFLLLFQKLSNTFMSQSFSTDARAKAQAKEIMTSLFNDGLKIIKLNTNTLKLYVSTILEYF